MPHAVRVTVNQQMGRTITIASQKGGVGKTTTAVNLASTLCLGGKKVLLMDLDPQGNASSGVGFHRSSTLPSSTRPILLSRILEGDSLAPLVHNCSIENLSIIPASAELSELSAIKQIQESAVPRFRKQIEALAEKYDYIFIDCPPSLGGLPSIALGVTDSVLIPIQCEYYAMEGLSQILPVIEEQRREANPKLEILGLLLTMYSDELELSHEVVEEVKVYFKDIVFHTIIPRDVVLAEAASHGMPAFQYAVSSRGVWSYVELAREVLAL